MITPTGPKISSFTICMFSVVFVKIVGSMKKPSVPCRFPPVCTVAPSFLPDSM
jgi:hypothetical protein